MEYKLKFENGRSCEIYCESDGKPLQDKINAAEERFGSQVKTINGKEVKEHGLGGFLVGAIIGGLAGNAVAKKGVKKTIKSVARKTTSTVKRAVDSVKKKEAPKSKRSNYIPNRLIDSIETKSGKTIENKDIIDGAHTKSNVLVSRKRVDSQPKDIDKSKKLSIQADYLSARKIKLVNTTYGRKLKGSEILDGAYVKKGVFADGGSIDSFNWNKFTIQDLVKVYPDIQLAHLIEGGTKYISNYKSLFELEKIEFKLDHSHRIEFQRGDENYYLDIPVQKESSKLALGDMYTITLYTKDNPIGLKKIATTLVEKFKDGGSTESRPNFSSMSKEELIDYSKKNNIPYATGWSTEKLIDTIEDTLDSRYSKGGGVKKLSTSEKLDLIAKRMYGKTYSQLMKKGRVTNGVQGFKRSEESEKVFKQYLKEYSIPGSQSSSYADGGGVGNNTNEIYSLAENMTDTEYDVEYNKLNKKQKTELDILIRLGDTPKLALATILLSKDIDENSETWNLYRYAKGGGVDSKRYKVIIYHGGEQRNQVKYASTLEEARELSFQGEHSEIVDTKTNKLVYEDGGSVEYAKGGVVLDWKYDKSKGKWRVAVYDPVNETAIAFFDRDEEAENYIVKKKLNKLDRYFSQLQKPDVFVSDKGIYVDFISKYNYEISIEMKFNRTTGKYVIGQVSHATDDWKYDYESVSENVGGFENNSKDFELLKSTTESIVINSLKFNGIVSNSDQENYLKSDLEKQLQLLFETWKGLSSKKMSNGGTTDKKYYVVDAFKLVQGASKPIVASFNSFAEAKQDAKSRNSSYDPDTKPFIVKDAKYLKSEGVELFEGGGKLKWADARKGDSARVVAENKMGMIVKDYGRKFHLKFPDGTEKTYDASELEFYKLGDDYDEYAKGGGVNGGSIDDYTKNLARVKVKFSNPKYDYTTSVSGEITESDARKYFVGNMFDRGTYPRENMQRVIDIEFYPKGTYAKGGMTEHGLRLGDKILKDAPYKLSEYILVEDKRENKHFVDLNRGERGKAFAKGGVIGQEITFNHWSGDVKRGTIDEVHSTGDYIVQSGFGSMLVNPDDVISINAPAPEKKFLGIFEDGGFVPSGYVVVIANNERLEFPAKYHFDEKTQKESIEDIDFEGSPDYQKLYNYISKEFNEWIENSRDYEEMYYGDGDQPAMFNKSGAIWDAIHTIIYEDLVQKKKEGKPAVINLDKYESDFISAFEYEKGGKLKYAKGGSVDSSLLTAEENNMLKLILKHSIFDGYKEIQTFTSGGGNYHTMILLSNNHIVTINYESEDIQYSFDTYDSIDQYLDPDAFPGEEKGWDNEYYTPDSETRTANANLDNIVKFFDKLKAGSNKEKSNKQKLIDAGYSESDAEDFADEFEQGGVKVPQKVKDILSESKSKTKIQDSFAGGGRVNYKLLNEIDPAWVDLLRKVLSDPIFVDYQAISTFYDDYDGLFTAILLKNNHIVYIAWDGMQMTYSYKEYKSIAQFKKGEYDKEMEDYIGFEDVESGMPDYNKRWFSFYNSKSSEDIRNFFEQFEK